MKRSGSDERAAADLPEPTLTAATQELGAGGPEATAPAEDLSADLLPVQLRARERYRVLGEHGRGGLGRVSRAHDRELGRDVAIKELLAGDHFNEARFLREVLITARLEHPSIVPIHEAGRWPDGTPFYAMKLVSGRPLHDLIVERPVDQRIGLLNHIVAVTDAIAYAHGRNIIHRDLKPANIIVGEFGETIVIDWGIAKDLGEAEQPSIAGSGPLPAYGELTSQGAILGTPSYMAPEQARGERVDERADVYAIGLMLWELCAADKRPPAEPRARHRVLRRANIDRDLAAIIEKAIEPDLARRYRDAGALMADLKAFTSGLRIAARHYSVLDTIAHWTRHHRALARSAALLAAILLIGGVGFVWNISIERDRADASEKRARAAQATSEAALAELILNHAQLLLTTDPSAALDELTHYTGANHGRAEQIRAEAMGRGVAVLRATPHSNNAIWAQGEPDGTVTTVGIDGTIARTSRAGAVAILARGVSGGAEGQVVIAYAPERHLLAYSCEPHDLCLFDVRRATRVALADAFRGVAVTQLAFAPTGNRLAVGASDGTLTVYDVTAPEQPIRRTATRAVAVAKLEFADDATLVVDAEAGLAVVDRNGGSRLLASGVGSWTVDPLGGRLAFSTRDGLATVVDLHSQRPAVAASLCSGEVSALRFVPVRELVAYECKRGTLGTWDPQRAETTPRAQLEGRYAILEASSAGDYLVAAGGNGVVTLVDLVTGLVTTYRGQQYRLMFVTPPSAAYPFTISGDVRGGIRVWPTPLRVGGVVADTGIELNRVTFTGPSTDVVAISWDPTLIAYSPRTGTRTIAGHDPANIDFTQSSTGDTLAMFDSADQVELWSTATMTRDRVVRTGHGSVAAVQFVGDGGEFITAGDDGRLIRWPASGSSTVLVQQGPPIATFVAIRELDLAMYATSDGALWAVSGLGPARPVRPVRPVHPSGGRVHQMIAHPDHQTVYAAYTSGDVFAIDTTTLAPRRVLHGGDAIERIVISGDGRSIAVATRGGEIDVARWPDHASSRDAVAWTQFAGRARDLAMARDGLLLAVFTDGTLWAYSEPVRRWLCLPLGGADLGSVAASRDGDVGIVADKSGRLVWLDLVKIRQLLSVATAG